MISLFKKPTILSKTHVRNLTNQTQTNLIDRASHRQLRQGLKKFRNFNIKLDSEKNSDKLKVKIFPTEIHKKTLLGTGNWLQTNLPIRLAKVVLKFRKLPFHVATQEDILNTHETYLESYKSIKNIPLIKSTNKEKEWENLLIFTETLREKLDWHNDTLKTLVKGFSEVFDDTDTDSRSSSRLKTVSFLDEILAERLALRLLADHHIKCMDYYMSKDNNKRDVREIGMVHYKFDPEELVRAIYENQLSVCLEEYGAAPEIKIERPRCITHDMAFSNARIDHFRFNPSSLDTFRYIRDPLEYALKEIFKNSMRAHVKAHVKDEGYLIERMPPIKVIIVQNDEDFIIKISDRGNGIPHRQIDHIWDYGFTIEDEVKNDVLLGGANMTIQNSKSMHGYGFGLPVSKVYIEKMGGKIYMETMQNYGTDTYIRLPYIDKKYKNKGFYKDIEL